MKKIEGYDNYMADESGKIYSNKLKRFLKPIFNQSGYHYVILQNKGVKKKALVHRIIATCFLHNEFNKPFVNHIDGVKTNNCLDNLEWCTQSENTIHAFKNGLMKVSQSSISTIKQYGFNSAKKVLDISNGNIYKSAKEASVASGINYKTLNGYLNGKYPNKTNLVYMVRWRNW